jgi:transposase
VPSGIAGDQRRAARGQLGVQAGAAAGADPAAWTRPTPDPSGPGAGRLLADKAYSSKANRAYLRRRGISSVIPERADEVRNRAKRGAAGGRPPAFDPSQYADRNVVERAINKLKQNRAVATRYDKRDYVWRGTVDVATIRIWLRDPVH